MMAKAFQKLVLAAMIFGVAACSPSSDPSYQKISPLGTSQRARFDRTAQLIGEVTLWKDGAGKSLQLIAQNLTASDVRTQGERKAQVFSQMGERCSLVNEVRPEKNPTPTPVPVPNGPKTASVVKGVMSQSKTGVECPVQYDWKQETEKIYAKDSENLTKTTVKEDLNFEPLSGEAKIGLNVQKYQSKVSFSKEPKDGKEILTGSGQGTLVVILDGTMQTIVSSMRTWGSNQGDSKEFGLSYYFVYGDGLRVELRVISKAGTPVYTINEQTIDEKEFESYLSKFGIPSKPL